MDEARRQFVLQLMQPMIREFHMTVIEMRERGQTETEIAAMLDKIEVENRGKVEEWILDAIMSELRLAARHYQGRVPPHNLTRRGLTSLHSERILGLSVLFSTLEVQQCHALTDALTPEVAELHQRNREKSAER